MKYLLATWAVVVLVAVPQVASSIRTEMFNLTDNTLTRSFRQGRKSSMSDSCDTGDGGTGTCLTRFNCMRQGGIAKSYCGTYGVCCETNMQCNGVSKLKRTVIKNPGIISEIPTSCQYTIQAFSLNVCQLRIDFQTFELEQPTFDPVDQTLQCGDSFTVSGFTLCGENSGQHLYIPFSAGGGIDHVTLTFNMVNRASHSKWRLIVTQLECPVTKQRSNLFSNVMNQNSLHDLRSIFSLHHADYDLLAPAGCDQYYTNPTGTIRSFNYKDGQSTYYMQKINLVICVKPLPGATIIEYAFNKFSLSQQDPDFDAYDQECHGTVLTTGRKQDYLMIPQSMLAPMIQPTYYCGTVLNDRVAVMASPPFIMYFSTDEITDALETGFSLSYRVASTLV